MTTNVYLSPSFAQVELDRRPGVDGEPLVRVDGHAEQAGVRLNNQHDWITGFRMLAWHDHGSYNLKGPPRFLGVDGGGGGNLLYGLRLKIISRVYSFIKECSCLLEIE